MATFSIVRQLTAAVESGIVELVNVSRFYNEIAKDFPPEYWLDANFILESLDLASNLSDVNLAPAPFPATDIVDNNADKAVKVAETWRKYPRIGLQLHLNYGGNFWVKKGQPIVIQNTPVQFPIPLVSPYLNATARVFLLGKNDRLGISVVSGTAWSPIKEPDYITISGALRVDIQPKEKLSIPVKDWATISKQLPANQLMLITPKKPNRRCLTLTNAGNTNIYCGFGGDIGLERGLLLSPGGSFSWDSERYNAINEFYCFSVDGTGLVTGQEALI